MTCVLLQPAWALQRARYDGDEVADGIVLWHGHGASVVTVGGSADPVRALEALRRAGVRRLDLVVATGGGSATSEVVRALDARYRIGEVWAPAGHQVRGARVPPTGTHARAGPFEVIVGSNEPRLRVDVRRAR